MVIINLKGTEKVDKFLTRLQAILSGSQKQDDRKIFRSGLGCA